MLVSLRARKPGSCIPSPSSDGVLVPAPSSSVPTPVGAGPTGPAPAPGGLFSPTPDQIGQGPSPFDVPAPVLEPSPMIATEEPVETDEPLDTGTPSPAPIESQHFFCVTAVECRDCSGAALDSLDQAAVDMKWNDSRCDGVNDHGVLFCLSPPDAAAFLVT